MVASITRRAPPLAPAPPRVEQAAQVAQRGLDSFTRHRGASTAVAATGQGAQAPSCRAYDWLPGIIEGPRGRVVSPLEFLHRAVATPGDALVQELAPLVTAYVAGKTTDLMAYTNGFLDHLQAARSSSPDLAAEAALSTYRPSRKAALRRFDGTDCGGLVAQLVEDAGLEGRAFVAPAQALQYVDPGVPSINHMALLVPFAAPDDVHDRGYVLIDPGMHLDVPIAVRWNNNARNPVRYRQEGIGADMSFWLRNGAVHFRQTAADSSFTDVVVHGQEFENYEAAVSGPLLVMQDNARIGARNADGSLAASVAINLKRGQVNMRLGTTLSHVKFEHLDAEGAWLTRHAPGGDARAYAAALHATDAQELAGRVAQIVDAQGALAQLRERRMQVLQRKQRAPGGRQPC